MTNGGFGFGLGAAGSEEVEGAVIGCCGGLKVGYLTEVSCRKVSISRGEDFIFSTDIIRCLAKIRTCIIILPVSVAGGNPESSRASFFTRASSLMPPQHVRRVFHRTRRSYRMGHQKGTYDRFKKGTNLLNWIPLRAFIAQSRHNIE